MIRVFTGRDRRETDGWHNFIESLVLTSSNYRLMPPLSGAQKDGTNAFTYARFEVLEQCNWAGPAIFVDASDMILQADISELADLFDKTKAVQVVKHDYKTSAPRKYIGTDMEAANADYPRKNWSSVILWNCGHPAHWQARNKIRAAIEAGDGKYLHRFGWLEDRYIGELPIEWNWLPQEHGENPEAKLIHYTLGIPSFKHYANCAMSQQWHAIARTIHSER